MTMKGRCFSLATPDMARAVPELVPPNRMDRFWLSIHSRAFDAATSALFWWSAESSSIGRPRTLPPKSSTAHFIISTPAGPSMSAYRLDMSVMKPMRTGPVWAWAKAPVAAKARARAAARVFFCITRSPCCKRMSSNAQVFLEHAHVFLQLRLRELTHDAAVLHHVEAVGQRRGEAEVLFHQHDRVAL